MATDLNTNACAYFTEYSNKKFSKLNWLNLRRELDETLMFPPNYGKWAQSCTVRSIKPFIFAMGFFYTTASLIKPPLTNLVKFLIDQKYAAN